MHLLIIIGAGASFDCWPEFIERPSNYESIRLPLANNLFSPLLKQNEYLDAYKLMGLASILRGQSRKQGDKFNIEKELAGINDLANTRKDHNTLQNLFKARFYLHRLITSLTAITLENTHSHTLYVDLLTKLKGWIDESPSSRYVDLVVFNYDNLIEKAMENVYCYDWYSKNINSPLNAYWRGKNLRIFKPHGSINWGREVLKNGLLFSYQSVESAFIDYDYMGMTTAFQYIDPNTIANNDKTKNYIPAIAIPFKNKSNFEECPQDMQSNMLGAIQEADKIITIGWKGGEENFTELLKTNNKKIGEVYIVSPNKTSNLSSIFSAEKLKSCECTFKDFVSETPVLDNLLETFDKV